MDFEKIVEFSNRGLAMAERLTDDDLRNFAYNLHKSSGYIGISPYKLRTWHIEDSKTVYDADLTRDQSLKVITSIRDFAQSWIDRPVQG